MQAGYRRDPAESAKALKSKLKAKRRDSILYGAVIKQQSALSTIGNAPIPPSTPGAPNAPAAPTELPSIGSSQSGSSSQSEPSSELSAYPRGRMAPRSTPTGIDTQRPMGAIDAKVLQERLLKLKKHDQTMVKPAVPTKKEEMEAAYQAQKSNLKPHDSRKPTVGINANPQASTVASQSDIGEVSPMIPSAAPATATMPVVGAKDPLVQDSAKELLGRINTIRTRESLSPVKQITISAYDHNGIFMPVRFIVKDNGVDRGYRFDIDPKATGYSSKNLMKNDQGIHILDSMKAAISKVSKDSYNAKAATAEVNGLGFNESDPTKISSSRIAWMNSRDSGRKLPKGMIYVMGPSLLKGDLRVYSKSGKPVMSASKISPAFQRIVRDTIDRNTFDPQDYSTIEPSESADVNHFISISKPIAPSGIDRLANADGIWKLKKRYEVLVGELSAGNDGALVRQEMEAILRSLMRMHAINPAKAKDLIKALHDY